jgi:hypothetical protein
LARCPDELREVPMPLKMSVSHLVAPLVLLSATAVGMLAGCSGTSIGPVAKGDADSRIVEDRSNSPVSPEEYGVYSVAIANQREIDTTLVLVSSLTVPFRIDNPDTRPFPTGAQPSTVEDYRVKNQSASSIADHFTLPVKHVLVDGREIESLVRKGTAEPWRDFMRKYPDAQSVCRVSRVGFNHNRDQALVFVHKFRPGGGTAEWVLLAKHNGAWNVKASLGPTLN